MGGDAWDDHGGRDERDGTELSPGASLEMIESERRNVRRGLGVDPAPVFGMWGVTFLLGWGACYLAVPQGPGPFLPVWAAVVLLVVLYVMSIALPIVLGARAGRGVRGPSRTVARMYGWAWALGFGALNLINGGLIQTGLPSATITLLWSGTSLLVMGLLYLAGGMVWRDHVHYALGVWMLAAGAGSVFAGYPGDFLVLSLAGGGGFLLWAGVALVTGWGCRR